MEFYKILFGFIFAAISYPAIADLITGPDKISFSSATGAEAIAAGSFSQTVDGIFDICGVSNVNNGVAVDSLPVSITYNFDRTYKLDAFFLYGEVGSNGLNAVKDFRLDFFNEPDGKGTQIGSSFTGVQTDPCARQIFNFVAGVYRSVRSFVFTPLSISNPNAPNGEPNRVEYSELQFLGKADNLSLTDVQVTQAVFNSDIDHDGVIDLVKDRTTAIIATVELSGGDFDKVLVSASVDDTELDPVELTVIPGEVGKEEVPPIFFTPRNEGIHNISVIVDPDGTLGDNPDDNINEQLVSVHATSDIHIPYVRIRNCAYPFFLGSCYSTLAPAEFEDHRSSSNVFLRAILPISDTGFSGENGGTISGTRDHGRDAVLKDLKHVWQKGKSLVGNAKRAVGIIKNNYFLYHNEDSKWDEEPTGRKPCQPLGNGLFTCATGVWLPMSPHSVLVQAGITSATAHEIGHSFGFTHEEVGYCGDLSCPGNSNITGYWVEQGTPINNAIDFMGLGATKGELFQGNTLTRWVNNDHWERLFTNFKGPNPDPKLILMSGLISRDGIVEDTRFTASEGTADVSNPSGTYSVQTKNSDGNIIAEIRFDLGFTIGLDPIGEIPSDKTVFMISAPYDLSATMIEMRDPNGNIVLHVDPAFAVLNDAISRSILEIPDFCFTSNIGNERTELAQLMLNYKYFLENKQISAAITVLADIRENIDVLDMLIDECKDEIDLGKAAIADLIEDTETRLDGRIISPIDTDGDGVTDENDLCQDSDLTLTVIIDGCDSDVGNSLMENGCTISDQIISCSDGAENHGKFVSCVSKVINDLKKTGIITGQQKGAIQSCAAQAAIP